jgi:hypothetical protein
MMENPLSSISFPALGSVLTAILLALPLSSRSAADPAAATTVAPAAAITAVRPAKAPAAAAPPAGTAAVAQPASVVPGEIAGKRVRKPAPLQRLIFSARQGFSLRMVSNEQVTAEIRNGAGRTLARASYSLEAGDWKLHPKNLAPGLYTVLLKTGAQLRAMRMKIDDTERGPGSPEWVLERAPADSSAAPAAPDRGADSAPGADPTAPSRCPA